MTVAHGRLDGGGTVEIASDGAADLRRPVQTALVEGCERAVGPVLHSFVAGDNSALIAAVAPLYLTGSVLDVTYGRGVWWRRFTPPTFAAHDLATDGVDFRDLPYADASWDTVCFDPPYMPTRSPETTAGIRGDFRGAYGLGERLTRAELAELIAAGLEECSRVARRWILAKCCDYAQNAGSYVLGHVETILAGQELGLRVHDLIVHAGGTGPGNSAIAEPKRARRAHSYLVVFAVPRRRARRAAT